MAVATLSPWPTSSAAVALAAARTCLGDALGLTDESTLDRLGSTAAELVERYAPGAPQAIKNESVVRAAGWMYEQPSAAVRSESVGDISTSYAATHMSALRHSGGQALLTGWKQRRAGHIG